jgi:hypothetical protein
MRLAPDIGMDIENAGVGNGSGHDAGEPSDRRWLRGGDSLLFSGGFGVKPVCR